MRCLPAAIYPTADPMPIPWRGSPAFTISPKAILFDLVPEFYCADYLLGWMGEAVLAGHLRRHLGSRWCLRVETGEMLKRLWCQGNHLDIFSFVKTNGLGKLTPAALMKRWERLADSPRPD